VNTTLAVLGVVLLGAAAVGGGLKYRGIEVPLLASRARQWLLAVVGVMALAAAFVSPRLNTSAQTSSQTLKEPMATGGISQGATQTAPAPSKSPASGHLASPPVTLPPAPQSQNTEAVPSSGVTSLPLSSSLRKQRVGMDQVCADFGLSQHAWLPGQVSATNLSGRVIYAQGAAYTWSCTKNGPKLTRDDITRGCQIWYPGTTAYTWDPNNAYSWVCV